MVNESSTPYETAERLQSEGLYVFPLEDGGKRPRRGLKWTSQATLDARSLTQWAQKHPAANYAIATGPSGLVVLDEDKPGELTRLANAIGAELPATRFVSTSRGTHYYFTQDKTTPLGCPQRARQEGYEIDVRGKGGYVVAPGSIHPKGTTYTAHGRDIAPIPHALANWLSQPPASAGTKPTNAPTTPIAATTTPTTDPHTAYALAALASEAQQVASTPIGARNHALNKAAFKLARKYGDTITEEDALEELTAAAIAAGLPLREAQTTAARAWTQGLAISSGDSPHTSESAKKRGYMRYPQTDEKGVHEIPPNESLKPTLGGTSDTEKGGHEDPPLIEELKRYNPPTREAGRGTHTKLKRWHWLDMVLSPDNDLTPSERFLATLLASSANDNGNNAWGSREWLASRMGVTPTTVKRAFAKLRARGWIQQTVPARRGRSPRYRLTMPSES